MKRAAIILENVAKSQSICKGNFYAIFSNSEIDAELLFHCMVLHLNFIRIDMAFHGFHLVISYVAITLPRMGKEHTGRGVPQQFLEPQKLDNSE